MSNVTVEKVKVVKAPEQTVPDVKAETPKAEVSPVVTPVVVTQMDKMEKAIELVSEKMTKIAGSYDGKYQEDGVQGVPGTKGEKTTPTSDGQPDEGQADKKAEGDYDDGYAKGVEPDGDEDPECDDYEECSHCKGKGKMKKAVKKDAEEEEEEEEETLPKKAELSTKADLSVDAWRAHFGFSNKPSKAMQTWKDACDNFTNPVIKE
jgi:hypothetical protein